MRKIYLLPIFLILLLFVSCDTTDVPCFEDYVFDTAEVIDCDTVFSTDLLAGQTIPVGSVNVSVVDDDLLVNYTTTGDWVIDETHVFVGDCADIPLSGGCNPQFGLFPYTMDHNPAVQSYTYVIPVASLDSCFCFIAHAAVSNPVTGDEETAIGNGDYDFPGNRWGWISTICLGSSDDCDPCVIEEGDFRTQTQGGWGAMPNGNNPGVYLHNNFNGAYPSGVTIGCSNGNTITLTSAQAVTDFLPQGGSPDALGTSYVNPTVSDITVLAGNLLAVQLALGFDQYDPNFGASGGFLGDLVINQGDFQGWTVSELVALGNEALGGCNTTYSLSSINDALSAISNNFVDGTSNQGFLDCP